MANRNFSNSRIYSMHVAPVEADCDITIGATGAVSSILGGQLISSVTRLSAGTYQIRLTDNYTRLFSMESILQAPVTGSAVAGGALSVGTVYSIQTLGSTTQAQWVAAGVDKGITAAPGVIFKAATAGAGTGTVKAIGNAGIAQVEVISGNNMLASANAGGGIIVVQCLAPTSSSVTTMIPTDPAQGSVLGLMFLLSNSSLSINGS